MVGACHVTRSCSRYMRGASGSEADGTVQCSYVSSLEWSPPAAAGARVTDDRVNICKITFDLKCAAKVKCRCIAPAATRRHRAPYYRTRACARARVPSRARAALHSAFVYIRTYR